VPHPAAFLLAYAPNLNAIERLWKVMHEHVTLNRYYENFPAFPEAIMRIFKTTLPNRWKWIRDTVTDNFTIVRPDEFRIIG
jgi:transposase